MRQTGVESIAETSAERESRRDESRILADTKHVSKDRRKAREKPRAMTA